jgi:hypothetical protein
LGHDPDRPVHTKVPHAGDPVDPAARFPHTPGASGELQASQAPAQAVLQHTPSTQKPDLHWFPEVHRVPLDGSARHRTPVHWKPSWHSRSVVHLPGHTAALPEQANGAQDGTPWLPAGTWVQTPSEPGTSQALHSPTHDELQHTPSVHCPEAHWLAAVHGSAGVSLGSHTPDPLQKYPWLHAASEVHRSGQVADVPEHR